MVKPVLFGKFCLLERISVGGMAEVFRAKPLDAPGFEKFLAVKRILPNLAEDDEFIAMFIDEAKIAVQLTHRNICQIFELGRLNDSHYIVMEFISGRDILAIQNRMRRERRIMSVGQSAYLCRQIACGLDHAHQKTGADGNPLNIIHRDISPQNVLVSYTGEVKVIDFGIAKAATRSQKTQAGVLKGKFGYMSPEQVRGLPLNWRSDIFALGTLFHEMLTCRRLFHGESDFATLEKVRKGDVALPSTLNPNVPPEIDQIVAKALQPDPDQRYQHCSEMMDDLDNFLSKLRPPYTERTLANWMQRTFDEDLVKERSKRQAFAQFKTADDVREHNERMRKELAAQMGLSEDYDGNDKDEISSEATQIWDSSAAHSLPGLDDYVVDEDATMQDVDLPELANLHTQIADMSQQAGPTTPMKMPPMGGGPSGLRPPPPTPTGPVAYVPPSMAHLYANQQPPPTSGVTKLGVALVVSFVLMSLLIVAGVVYVFFFTDLGRAQATGSLFVKTTPVQEVEVLLNGKLIATRTPHMHSNLGAGRYTLEVRNSDYSPSTRIVTVEGGQQLDVTVDMTPLPVGSGMLTVNVKPPEAELHVDGKLVSGTGAKRLVKLDDRNEHLIEARLSGYYVEEFRLDISDGQQITKSIKLRKINAEIKLTSNIVGKVYLDGKAVGKTPYNAVDLDPLVPHEVEIRAKKHHPWKKKVIFYPSHTKTYKATLRRTSDDPPPEEIVKVGYLTVDSGNTWWRILVNDWDTGMTTPITSKRRLTLPVGQHTISYVRGDKNHSVQITIEEGKTSSLNKTYALK